MLYSWYKKSMDTKNSKHTIYKVHDNNDLSIPRETDQGTKRALLYFKFLLDDNEFLQRISEIREKYNIDPSNQVDGLDFGQDFTNDLLCLGYEFALNDSWLHALYYFTVSDSYDESDCGEPNDICDISMIQRYPDAFVQYMSYAAEQNPVAILINPYSSLNDILDYISKNYKARIHPIQNKHKKDGVRIQKLRTRKTGIEARDTYIDENRDTPIQELLMSVNQKFQKDKPIDYNHLQKILRKNKGEPGKYKKGK